MFHGSGLTVNDDLLRFALQLVICRFILASIAEGHVFVRRAAAIGLVWLAQKTPGTSALGTLTLEVHDRSPSFSFACGLSLDLAVSFPKLALGIP